MKKQKRKYTKRQKPDDAVPPSPPLVVRSIAALTEVVAEIKGHLEARAEVLTEAIVQGEAMVEKAKAAPKKQIGFNLLSRGASRVTAVKESLVRKQKKFNTNFVGDPNRNRLIIPIPEFPLAYALRSRGFQAGTMLDVIAPEGCGKTTLMWTIIGWFIRHNAPCFYVETENKPMMESRIDRCLHWDRKLAAQMRGTVHMESSREIVDCYEKTYSWLKEIRESDDLDVRVPMDVPALICWDTFSKLLSPGEAQGVVQYKTVETSKKDSKKKENKADKEKREKKEVAKALNEGSNLEHAKLAAKICRQLPYMLGHFNAFFAISRHQSQKVDMGGGGGSLIPADVAAAYNKTSIGGNAFGQSGAYQMIISRKGFEKASVGGQPCNVGENLGINVCKNSFGPPGHVKYRLMTQPRLDTETYQETALDFNAGLVDTLISTRMVALQVFNKNSITCKALKLEKASLQELAEAFYAHPTMMPDLMKRLEFVGCEANIKYPVMNDLFATAAATQFVEDGESVEEVKDVEVEDHPLGNDVKQETKEEPEAEPEAEEVE